MLAQHPLAELAPRDVVACGIHRQLVAGKGVHGLTCGISTPVRFANDSRRSPAN
ncbi:MAG: hypothetical protein R2845_11605 [Thermomicrobiales bacterium]